jgi:4'-phosphopantetheinyl transferase
VPPFLHIWRADLTTRHPGWLAAEATLSVPEQSRQARLRTLALRQTYGRAHGFLRMVLEQYTFQAARFLALATDHQGKPQLPGAGLHFNLSYRPGRALLALSDTGPVGADVEALALLPGASSLVTDLFSVSEQEVLRTAPPGAWWPTFYAIWTRKEAYAKALGMGLATPFTEFSVLAPGPEGLPLNAAPAGASLHSFAVGGGFQGAVAVLAPDAPAPQHFSYPFNL